MHLGEEPQNEWNRRLEQSIRSRRADSGPLRQQTGHLILLAAKSHGQKLTGKIAHGACKTGGPQTGQATQNVLP
jgi:hypothetical protein